ncbi:hypothetical protein J2741_000016 [Methanolinea mesophila]|uniref:hypothetical protein n=1 Tax=Methanolinea mesophila TaxID=547055 RepID=UPI001AE208AD|nr:hypothetical protein [Methanolinea mesophila]MBP1927469.1 hypothetical protein [Methanolinea mesophila]
MTTNLETWTCTGAALLLLAMLAVPAGAIETVPLGEGWNIFSTPVSLQAGQDTFSAIFAEGRGDNLSIIITWDDGMWVIPDPGYHVGPLEAYYIKNNGWAEAVLVPSTSLAPPPSRELAAGINLFGPAPPYENSTFVPQSVEEALITVEEVEGGLPGYVMVISPAHGQPGWVYTPGMPGREMLPFKGYWVIMENPGMVGGFTSTPLPG